MICFLKSKSFTHLRKRGFLQDAVHPVLFLEFSFRKFSMVELISGDPQHKPRATWFPA